MNGLSRYPFMAGDQHPDMGANAGPSRMPQAVPPNSSLRSMITQDMWDGDDDDDGYSETSAIRLAPRPEPPREREFIQRSPRAEFRDFRPPRAGGPSGPAANGHHAGAEGPVSDPVTAEIITLDEGKTFFDL